MTAIHQAGRQAGRTSGRQAGGPGRGGAAREAAGRARARLAELLGGLAGLFLLTLFLIVCVVGRQAAARPDSEVKCGILVRCRHRVWKDNGPGGRTTEIEGRSKFPRPRGWGVAQPNQIGTSGQARKFSRVPGPVRQRGLHPAGWGFCRAAGDVPTPLGLASLAGPPGARAGDRPKLAHEEQAGEREELGRLAPSPSAGMAKPICSASRPGHWSASRRAAQRI